MSPTIHLVCLPTGYTPHSRFFSPPPPPPSPLQYGGTPLHVAVGSRRTPIVALLLATPGVDPLSKDAVRGAQRRFSRAFKLPIPPSATE